MKFKLHSKFTPTGDQPQAIDELTKSIQAGEKHQTLLGVTGSGKTFSLANVIQNVQKPTLVISHNKTLAGQLYQEFRDFFPENAVSYFVSYYDYYQPEAYVASTDTYIEKEVDINDEIDKLRLSSTANLLTRPDTIVVASVSCIYNLGSPLDYASQFLQLIPGQLISRDVITRRLIDMQYSRNEYELARSSFRIKGDTLQLWPAYEDYALNISFLENKIEKITKIDPVSGNIWKPESLEARKHGGDGDEKYQSKRITLYPAKHYAGGVKDQQQAIEEIKRDLAYRLQEFKDQGKIVEAYRLGQKVKHDLDMINELGYTNGIENYSRYFDGREPGDPPYTLLDYFKYNAEKFGDGNFLTVVDESHITLPQFRGMYFGDKARKENLIDYGFRLPSALDNRPLQFHETQARLDQTVYVSATPEEWELEKSKSNVAEQVIRPTGLVDPPITIKPTKGQIDDLIREVMMRIKKKERVLITTLTKKTSEALTEYLNDPKKIESAMSSVDDVGDYVGSNPQVRLPKVAYLHSDIDTLERSDILDKLRAGEFDVLVGINLLREGLDLPEVSLVAILEADKEGFLRSRTALIQIMGRAARHVDGQVIMYADRESKAMKASIEEVERRREIQLAYNEANNIRPRGIQKEIKEKLLVRDEVEEAYTAALPKPLKEFKHMGWDNVNDIDADSLTADDRKKLVSKLKREMNKAAKDWDFEKAAELRDVIKRVE